LSPLHFGVREDEQRTHDFITRVQATLILLNQAPVLDAPTDEAPDAQQVVVAGPLPDTDAVTDLHRPWTALSRWIRTNPSIPAAAACRPNHALADAEFAA
jgi:hypothetical protein